MQQNPSDKTIEPADDDVFAVRVTYQTPINVVVPASGDTERAYPYTFEDAFAFENLGFFSNLEGSGLAAKFRKAIETGTTAADIGQQMFEALRSGKKAELALDVIAAEGFDGLSVPGYIREGLEWLQQRLEKKQLATTTEKDPGEPKEQE